jgi:ABC-type multidrug transport system ATPase subunit
MSRRISGTAEADPFFKRRDGTTLDWSNVNVSLTTLSATSLEDNQESNKELLRNISGEVKSGCLTALMGPSGSGKSTLLNVLAGKLATNKKTKVEGDIKLGKIQQDPTSLGYQTRVAYFAQHDILVATATPREAINFSARLRLPSHVFHEEITELTETILGQLGLMHVANNMIGGAHVRGLSGGEQRRVSLGAELVVRPTLFLADEVTSGLDSHSALQTLKILKKVASCGAAVLITIHQPTSAMFQIMDHVIFLRRGRCMYQGTPAALPDYVAVRGYPVPANYSSAEWMVEVSQMAASEEDLEEQGFYKDFPGDDDSTESRVVGALQRRASVYESMEKHDHVSFATELWQLLKREALNVKRDSSATKIRYGTVILGGTLVAIDLNNVARNSLDSTSSFSSHVGALFLLMFVTSIRMLIDLNDFAGALPVFMKEYSTGHYRLWTHTLARFAFEVLHGILQTFLFLTIVYFSVGFNGNFFYLLAVMFMFALVLSSSAVMLGSIVSDPKNAKEYLQIALCKLIKSSLCQKYAKSTLTNIMTALPSCPNASLWILCQRQ